MNKNTKKRSLFSSIIMLTLIGFLLFGCTNDDDPVSPTGDFEQNWFLPLAKNNDWRYNLKTESENAMTQILITDTITHTDGTLLHVIKEGIVNFPNNEYHEYYYGNRDGDIYYYNSTNEVYNDSLSIPVTKKLILKDSPSVGQTWISVDTCKVLSFSDILVDTLNFNDVYAIEYKSLYKIDTLYFAKNIGIIKHNYEYRNFGKGKSEIYYYATWGD